MYRLTEDTSKIKKEFTEAMNRISFMFGFIYGYSGEPIPEHKDLKSEFIKGWKEGYKIYKEKHKKRLKKEVL